MNTVIFSVVIPLYNKVDSVSRTLASICEQRLTAAEIIVVDDGSTDGSADKVTALNIPNLILVKQKNQGVSAARNYGVSLAQHQHVAFIDADDQWSPFFLYEMSKLILRFPEHQCFASNYQKVFEDGDYRNPKLAIGDVSPTGAVMINYFEVCAKGDLPFMPSSFVITTPLFKQLGGFPVGEAMGEDQSLFSQVFLQASLVYSPLVLMLYHTDSENRACDRNIPQDLLPFAERLLEKVAADEVDKAIAPFVLRYCAAHICHLAKINIQAGQLSAAKQLLNHPVSKLKPLHRNLFGLWLISQFLFSTTANLIRVTVNLPALIHFSKRQ
ncbi:MAG: glycosyltransferase involved in cell wall biosynthesis [Paraglaciecola sp.]|jgi:glycosyltransferase involved in cell wall biosynthesis